MRVHSVPGIPGPGIPLTSYTMEDQGRAAAALLAAEAGVEVGPDEITGLEGDQSTASRPLSAPQSNASCSSPGRMPFRSSSSA